MATSRVSSVIEHIRRVGLVQDAAGMTDGQLLECYLTRREEAALGALVQRHSSMVWGVCRRILHHHHDAEDAFQATFLVLVRRARSVVPREMIGNWLYGVAHQTALKARATTARRHSRERQVVALPEAAAVEQDPWSDFQPQLDQELSRLPDKYRVTVVLCDLEGKSRKQAARQLGLPEGTVASRLARARSMLARRLARHGLIAGGGSVVAQQAASAGVPASMMSRTLDLLTLVATGPAASAVMPASVAHLAKGVSHAMMLNKFKWCAAGLLALTAATLTGVFMTRGPMEETSNAAEKQSVNVVQERHEEPPRNVTPDADRRQLQGRWVPVAGERYGERLSDELLRAEIGEVTFAGDTIVLRTNDGTTTTQPFTINPNKHPKEIDFKDPICQAIYELRGNQLRLCLPYPPEPQNLGLRPTKFAGTGPHRFLIVLERRPEPKPVKDVKARNKARPEAAAPPEAAPEPERESPDAWASKLFEQTSKDFGKCQRGEKLKYRFKMTNIYAVPLDIMNVRSSCGCLSASSSRTTLQPKETGYLEVVMDSSRFSGTKRGVLYVTVGPHYSSTATLTVSATSLSEEYIWVLLRVRSDTTYKKAADVIKALEPIPGVKIELKMVDDQEASMSAVIRPSMVSSRQTIARVRSALLQAGVSSVTSNE
jgi:RNA polymerase sigma factor (sigma-70 family)